MTPTFSIVKRKDEEKHHGDYRTKRGILEIYDAQTGSTRAGGAAALAFELVVA